MKRNSNIELLRILCIWGITVHHLVFHSTIMDVSLGISRLFAQFFILFGKSGVNIFVLISSYFLSELREIEYKKSSGRVFNLWKQTILYSVICFVFAVLFFDYNFSISTIMKVFLPITSNAYWFMTAFIGLMIFEPFLNQAVNKISLKTYQCLMCALILINVLPPINTWCNDLLWFIMLYFTAGYIRRFGIKNLTKRWVQLTVGIGCFIFMWIASLIISVCAERYTSLASYINYFGFRQNSAPMYVGTIALFLFAISFKPRTNTFINKMAKHTLPCYLIQSNICLSSKIWKIIDLIIPKDGFIYGILVVGIASVLVVCFICVDVVIQTIVSALCKVLAKTIHCN